MKAKIVAALFFVPLFALFALSTHAQSQEYNSTSIQSTGTSQSTHPYSPRVDPTVEQDLHTYSQTVLIEVLSGVSCLISGIDPVNPTGKCLGINPENRKIGYIDTSDGGAIGVMGNLIASTFYIPVSTNDYTTHIASNFGITKDTFAQGTFGPDGNPVIPPRDNGIATGHGFNSLRPVLALWETFRNLAYLIIVLIFVVIGLGIMFRIKIDPRTVMTIQNQIPKMVVALALITLSYAIAGFLIDMMYVFMFLIFNTFADLIPNSGVGNLNPINLQNKTALDAIGLMGAPSIAKDASSNIGTIVGSLFDGSIGKVVVGFIGSLLGGVGGTAIPGVGTFLGAAVGFGAGFLAGSKLIGLVGGLIAFLVITFAILFALFRLWFQLLRAYIFILIDVVFSPFMIMAGLLPGRPNGFGTWLREIVSNLAAFPTALTMFLLGRTFTENFASKASPADQFVPPFIGNPGDIKEFGAIIGLGILLMTPTAVQMTRETLKAPNFKYVAAVGQALGTGSGVMNKGFVGSVRTGIGQRDHSGKQLHSGPVRVLRGFIGL